MSREINLKRTDNGLKVSRPNLSLHSLLFSIEECSDESSSDVV